MEKTSLEHKDLFNNNRESTVENSTVDSSNDSINKFQQEFCGLDAKANSNTYVKEYILPQTCEMPLGIAVDSDGKKVWYVSTKKGILGNYDIKEKKFDQEHVIPEWSSRVDPHSFSQVWDMKVNRNTGDVWFTDEKDNAIWRYVNSSQKFEMYKIPGNSQYFGTTYPISMEFAPSQNNNNIRNDNDNIIFFVGTYSRSLWYANIAKLKNGTSEGISQIPLPIANEFKGIDPVYITIGSLAYDNKQHVIWISVMAYSKKGQIIRYNLDTKTFNEFDLPKDISSPLGMTVDPHSGDLWVTNAGTSIFYKLKLNKNSNNNNVTIVKFVTSKPSDRIFGTNYRDISGVIANDESTLNISKHAYTLPYWIKNAGRSFWFNEWEGNKIARFDPSQRTLIEYWIPSQNRLWGTCPSFNKIINSSVSNNIKQTCGIANILQFSIEKRDDNSGNAQQIWFTEWSENKIGKVDAIDRHLPFSVNIQSNLEKKELTIKRGESEKIKIKVKAAGTSAFHSTNDNFIHMVVSGTFTTTGNLDNSLGHFSKNSFTIDGHKKKKEIITFIFTPSKDLIPGHYMLMIGAENNAISFLKAIAVKIT